MKAACQDKVPGRILQWTALALRLPTATPLVSALQSKSPSLYSRLETEQGPSLWPKLQLASGLAWRAGKQQLHTVNVVRYPNGSGPILLTLDHLQISPLCHRLHTRTHTHIPKALLINYRIHWLRFSVPRENGSGERYSWLLGNNPGNQKVTDKPLSRPKMSWWLLEPPVCTCHRAGSCCESASCGFLLL